MYSDFYEIPLPALRFEKVEETNTKKWKRHRRETTPSKFDNVKKPKENDAQRKADSLVRKTTRKEDSKTLPEQKLLLSSSFRWDQN